MQLGGVSHVILAPDAKLNLVPFEALIDPQGHYTLEGYLVSHVTTGRDLLRFATPHDPRSSGVIMAAPDYGPSSSSQAADTLSFAPLAGALAEATDLQQYFSTPPLTGREATKSALAALTGPAMLHVATHGFYTRDPGARPTLGNPAPARDIVMSHDQPWLTPTPVSETPAEGLDRAGLAMAGANQGAQGIVTARELAGFDWWGTKLVVLSACETGVESVPSGDGVYGLRRALVLAGAESQVVSLWSVSDSSAPELMREYYGELARGAGRAEALRQAKLRMMQQLRYAHPYYWAAFIQAGDWRSLDQDALPRQQVTST
jgi:CHAT domain-containing protein